MLEAFKFIQDHFVGIEFSSDIVMKHQGYLDNIYVLDQILDALMKGEIANDEDGALDVAYNLNALCEYNYYIFSPEAARKVGAHADNSNDSFKWWGQDKGYKFTDTWEATLSLFDNSQSREKSFVEAMSQDARIQQENIQARRDARYEEMIAEAGEHDNIFTIYVIDENNKELSASRLFTCEVVKERISKGLELIGVSAPEEM